MTTTTFDAVIETLAAVLDVDVLHVDWLAQKLQRAGLLPPDGQPIEPLHAARLLVAVMASSRPLEAVAAVETFEALSPLYILLGRPTGFGDTSQIILPIENVPLDEGEILRNLTFVQILATVIELYSGQDKQPIMACPDRFQIRRGLYAPSALLFLGPCPTAPGATRALAYDLPDGNAAAEQRNGLEIWASVRGSILIELGAALAGRATTKCNV